MKLNNLVYMTLALALALVARLSFAAESYSDRYVEAYQQFHSVSDDQGGSARKLAKQWQSIVDANPEDPFALVMLGSSHTLMGRDAWMPWSKLRHTENGLDEMAMAQRLLTHEHRDLYFQGMSITHHVQTMAAITFTQVPDFFGRHEEGFYLFQDVLSDTQFLALPAEAKTFAFYYAISAARQIDQTNQAEAWLDQMLALNVEDGFTTAAVNLE